MAKDIAVFLDGTWNSSHDESLVETNVALLFQACNLPPEQRRYLSGVGALRESWPALAAVPAVLRPAVQAYYAADRLLGGATGLGVSRQIREAYAYVCSVYARGDRLFLFGFSRGAFAARSLSGFIHRVGLLLADRLAFVETAFLLYQMKYDGSRSAFRDYLVEVTGQPPLETPEDERAILVYFIGVWDTVGALGLPRWAAVLTDVFAGFHDTGLPPNVTHARHAVALHEMRPEYRPVLWTGTTRGGQDLLQGLFPGAHADVGGGYGDPTIADVTLWWMREEAERARGAPMARAAPQPLFDASRLPRRPFPRRIHCELRGWWLLLGWRGRAALLEPHLALLHVHAAALRPFRWDASLSRVVRAALASMERWKAQALPRSRGLPDARWPTSWIDWRRGRERRGAGRAGRARTQPTATT